MNEEQNYNIDNMIFEFSDYRSWLRSEIKKRAELNPLFSANAFSKKIGLSQGFLSLVLKGKKQISEETAKKISDKMQLSESETKMLILFVRKENSKSIEIKNLYENEIKSLKKELNINQFSLDMFTLISNWYYPAILESLLTTTEPTIKYISDHLNLDEQAVECAIKKLIDLDLVEKNGDNYFRKHKDFCDVPDIPSSVIRNYQREILEKALLALENQSKEERDITSLVLAIDKSKIPEAKDKIKKFSIEMLNLLSSGKKEEVYILSMNLFHAKK